MWYTKDTERVSIDLETNTETGLTNVEAKRRLDQVGANEFSEHKKESIFTLFFRQINSLLIYILIGAALISAFVGEYSDAIIIVLVILLNTIIGVIQESKAEKALEELKKMTTPKAIVKRDGMTVEIPSEHVVPGDIVIIDAGRFIPADIRLIETANFQVEESSLTGESVPVDKNADWVATEELPIADQRNMAFMSTLSSYGRAIGIVVNTGMQTEIGKIANLLGKQEKEQTPLQKKLAELGKILGIGAVIVSVIIFLIGYFQGRDVLDMFLISVSLAVAAIPEGLPAIVTIVLALGVQRMIERQAVVRKLPAVETLGAVSVICSDKTGTLTQNKMTVTKVYVNGNYLSMNSPLLKQREYSRFFEAMALCNDAVFTEEEHSGDPTEIALVAAAHVAGFEKQILDKNYERIFEIAFDSDRKMMTTVHHHGGRYFVMVKGALESILPKIRVTTLEVDKIKNVANEMSAEALRVLAIAYKEIPTFDNSMTSEDLEKELIFLGLTGMIDPPREEVKASIAQCKQAGIQTIMITGDNQKTAFAIAKDLGIANEEIESMSGSEIDRLSESELCEKVNKIRVFARVSPEHKVKIVKALKTNERIVAMTGDGVNDAPSLKQADVGVAMGKGGTDVAKGAADIVLTDDNFATIVAAVEEGRNIYQNIKKSILFLLSCNLGEIVTLFIAILLGWPAPLSAIHILWINLITDTLPAISLGLDPDDPDVMNQQPRSIKESIFAHGSGMFTLLYGLLIGSLTLFAFVTGLNYYTGAPSIFSIDFSNISKDALVHAQTMAFVTLSIAQLFHSLNLRSTKKSLREVGLFTNKFLLVSIFAGIALQALLVNVPVFNDIFDLHILSLKDWLFVLTLSLVPIIFSELSKAWKRIF
ncbi:cation-translocating P-type ATPase [Schinkia azotoformans]|uniref:cation-translocating P-type ATPase n=1 Tax=Schinkia azotoformans TaxID=1454 RepID=UPI002DB6469C|nr:cation-translocating P-type ATPase [Schinkia azotoformans]MEC1742976.1 cation-translocating P-type ATPase [Schinkia azotoformans]MEC1745348.1 cation-translocating P-type ATPase [Schinkia azotoformans]MEC1757047.1 cation-translocating P-type ATPase [Schinkia azotoformans]MEC1768210.1 cation-translocating P-type ATPase [Schinkia azotoformans]MEC1779034.1 cation-translocating P-type ATPase [Schinkia azotoformans]